MTAVIYQLSMPGMSTPGRRVGTPTEYRDAIIERTRKARERTGLNQTQMAEELTKIIGRPITFDTYRKWEDDTTLPIDVIMPLCDLARVHPWEFLGPVPFPAAGQTSSASKESAA